MGDFSLRAARIQLGALIAALLIAIVIAIGITTGAFVLSFAVQRDLARQGTLPENLAWILPVIVDSAILGSTIAIVILSKLKMSNWDKGFYIALAVTVVAISILGNAYHAFHAASAAQNQVAAGTNIGYVPLDPTIAALIAIIPPALVLAFTHGLGILIKATGLAYADYKKQIDENDAFQAPHSFIERGDTSRAPNGVARMSPKESTQDLTSQDLEGHDSTDDAHPRTMNPRAKKRDLSADLDWFIAQSDLPEAVKATARCKLADPSLTWEAIAHTSTPPVAASTSWRRYEKFDAAARAAGFENPPLIDMRESDVDSADADDLVAVN